MSSIIVDYLIFLICGEIRKLNCCCATRLKNAGGLFFFFFFFLFAVDWEWMRLREEASDLKMLSLWGDLEKLPVERTYLCPVLELLLHQW